METDATPAEQAESSRTSSRTNAGNSRIELITRGEPRRRWPLEQKQAIAAESFQPGVSPTAVARRYGISSGLLYAWRKALLAAQPAATSGSGPRFATAQSRLYSAAGSLAAGWVRGVDFLGGNGHAGVTMRSWTPVGRFCGAPDNWHGVCDHDRDRGRTGADGRGRACRDDVCRRAADPWLRWRR
jgi:transposase-like protein